MTTRTMNTVASVFALVTAVAAGAQAQPSVELLTNPSFETGPLGPVGVYNTHWNFGVWNADNSSIIDSFPGPGPFDGSRVLQVNQSGDVVANNSQVINVSGKVAADGSSILTCTFEVSAKANTGGQIGAFLNAGTAINPANTSSADVLLGQTTVVTGPVMSLATTSAFLPWTKYTLAGPLPAGTGAVWFDFQVPNANAPVGGVFVDSAACYIGAASNVVERTFIVGLTPSIDLTIGEFDGISGGAACEKVAKVNLIDKGGNPLKWDAGTAAANSSLGDLVFQEPGASCNVITALDTAAGTLGSGCSDVARFVNDPLTGNAVIWVASDTPCQDGVRAIPPLPTVHKNTQTIQEAADGSSDNVGEFQGQVIFSNNAKVTIRLKLNSDGPGLGASSDGINVSSVPAFPHWALIALACLMLGALPHFLRSGSRSTLRS